MKTARQEKILAIIEREAIETQNQLMEALARRELGMVMPGEIVFLFPQEEETGTQETEKEPVWRWK